MRGLLILVLSLSAGLASAKEPELKLVAGAKVGRLLGRPGERFEASGVSNVHGAFYVLFDNRSDVAVVGSHLKTARLIKLETTWRGNDFEGLTWDDNRKRFFASIEAERCGPRTFRARLLELGPDLKQRRSWSLHPDLADPGKGVEGLAHVYRNGKLFLLAQLEGNHGVGGKRGKDKGHGRVRVYALGEDGPSLVTTLKLPPTARLGDYAGLDVAGDRIAVVSQKTSKVWIGKLAKRGWKVAGPGALYRFPRPDGVKAYDSMEGITWVTPRRLAVTSDGARSRAGLAKSESIFLFDIP